MLTGLQVHMLTRVADAAADGRLHHGNDHQWVIGEGDALVFLSHSAGEQASILRDSEQGRHYVDVTPARVDWALADQLRTILAWQAVLDARTP